MAFATRLTPAMAARWRGAGLWSDETFATVLARWVRATPDREALTDGTHRLSYRELAHGIDRMAVRLRALGIGAGDVVTIQLPNWVEFAFVFFALERLGAVAVTVSVDFRSRELEYIMRFADSKMLVCCAEFRGFDHAAMAAELKPRLPALALVGLIRGAAREGMVSLDDVAAARGEPAGFVPVAMDADAVMRMAFTSGTTGNPKGVMHSHNTTLAAARILNGDLGLSSDDVMMAWLPLGLNWGYLTLIQSLLAGAKAVLLDRFTPAAALDLIARERVTYIPTAPASLTAILQQDDLDAPRSLQPAIRGERRCVGPGRDHPGVACAPRPAFCSSCWECWKPDIRPTPARPTTPNASPDRSAFPASHMGLRLVDAEGRDVAQGQEGEILL